MKLDQDLRAIWEEHQEAARRIHAARAQPDHAIVLFSASAKVKADP